ncbi:hypothetical protein VTL71DRAFT_2992 [Oculimacula yallundae]|uniref:DUF7726 domain-containing protein n=1 Tax=Oculimacula yallundae TaxID=86028 RepID=A0ABR4C5V7_9HELO
MPKAQRRTSGARAAPYPPAIKPGDTPSDSSAKKSASKRSSTANTKSDATPSKSTKKALADKSTSETNIPPKAKSASKTKKADSGPSPTSKPSEEDIAPTDTSSNETSPKSTTKKPSGLTDEEFALKQAASNFLEITLPGESDSSVPMHDTCSTLRHKINDLLGKNNTKPENGNPAEKKKDGTLKPFTKASFVRAIGCSNKTLETFLKAKRVMGGAESPVYPAAYMFFEKKRIWEGKKKTAGRLKVEEE